ncbi:hypothetical protein LTR78_006120 [Recurvomyces mirabilis]|uniref:Uncharacterized protein n=1 Tax=Recurvomyces mirabilis TaxID=574656 RepID=A0AAE0WLH7_9PEZI|nr:hypothetical protein LTR78_006120 [Recurvomyces mirabilis]KAK5151963.1 hypothetical protein LTS14_008737 [Recurvomyces mirabilis]
MPPQSLGRMQKQFAIPPPEWFVTAPEIVGPQSQSEPKPPAVPQTQSQDPADIVFRSRNNIVISWRNANTLWTMWGEGYDDLLATYLSGNDPGGFDASWDSQWSKEEFDVRHLHHAMELAREVGVCRAKVEKVLSRPQKLGLEPMPWQWDRFPESLDPGKDFSDNEEEMMEAIADAPHEAVDAWRSALPPAATEFQDEVTGAEFTRCALAY